MRAPAAPSGAERPVVGTVVPTAAVCARCGERGDWPSAELKRGDYGGAGAFCGVCGGQLVPEGPHYHVWRRSPDGGALLRQPRAYASRTPANRAAAVLGNRAAVLKCNGECIGAAARRRPRVRWGRVAADVAAALGVEPAAVSRALRAARAAERERRRQPAGGEA